MELVVGIIEWRPYKSFISWAAVSGDTIFPFVFMLFLFSPHFCTFSSNTPILPKLYSPSYTKLTGFAFFSHHHFPPPSFPFCACDGAGCIWMSDGACLSRPGCRIPWFLEALEVAKVFARIQTACSDCPIRGWRTTRAKIETVEVRAIDPCFADCTSELGGFCWGINHHHHQSGLAWREGIDEGE